MPRIHLHPTQRTTVTNPLSFPVHQNQSRSIFILGALLRPSAAGV